jgi:hypothetical protein
MFWADDAVVDDRAGSDEVAAGGQRGEFGIDQHVPVQHGYRDLEHHVVANHVDLEHTGQRFDLLIHARRTGCHHRRSHGERRNAMHCREQH